MKNILLIILSLSFNNLSAQNSDNSKSSIKYFIESDTVSMSNNNTLYEFIGNANYSDDMLEVNKADKIIYDRILNQLQIFSQNDVLINGPIKITHPVTSPKLKYNLSEKVVFIE